MRNREEGLLLRKTPHATACMVVEEKIS